MRLITILHPKILPHHHIFHTALTDFHLQTIFASPHIFNIRLQSCRGNSGTMLLSKWRSIHIACKPTKSYKKGQVTTGSGTRLRIECAAAMEGSSQANDSTSSARDTEAEGKAKGVAGLKLMPLANALLENQKTSVRGTNFPLSKYCKITFRCHL